MKFKVLIILLSLLLISALVIDYSEPKIIPMSKSMIGDNVVEYAENLIIQGRDPENNIWATRGFWAYKKKKNTDLFERQYHIPSGFSLAWLGNFSIIRYLIGRHVWVELLPKLNGKAVAISANQVWVRSEQGEFESTFKFKYPLSGVGGVGVGTALLPNGLLETQEGRIYIVEYWRNDNKSQSHIYVSQNGGISWKSAFIFESGTIRHIHSISQDRYNGSIYVATGDSNKEVKILKTNDFSDVSIVGLNSQLYRTIGFSFDERYIYWGTDTENDVENAGIYRMNKQDMHAEYLSAVTGCIYMTTRLKNNVIVMSEAREGAEIESDDNIYLYFINDGTRVTKVRVGVWKKNALFKNYSWARLARGSGNDHLYFTLLNTKEHDADLIRMNDVQK